MRTDTASCQSRAQERAYRAVVRRSEAFGGVVQARDLRHALRALLKRPSAPTQRVLAARSGVPERTVSRILHGHDQTTRFDIADALLVALDAGELIDALVPGAGSGGSDG